MIVRGLQILMLISIVAFLVACENSTDNDSAGDYENPDALEAEIDDGDSETDTDADSDRNTEIESDADTDAEYSEITDGDDDSDPEMEIEEDIELDEESETDLEFEIEDDPDNEFVDTPDGDVDDSEPEQDRELDTEDEIDGDGEGQIERCDPDCIPPIASMDCVGGLCLIPAGCFCMGSPTQEPWMEGPESWHPVTISRDYLITITEITQSNFESITGFQPSLNLNCGGDCPVESVTWFEALYYANRRSIADQLPQCYNFSDIECSDGRNVSNPASCVNASPAGIEWAEVAPNGISKISDCEGWRLPTEAEWEHAARAGSITALHPSAISDGVMTNPFCSDPAADVIAWYCGNSPNKPSPVGQRESNTWGLFDMAGNVAEWVWDPFREDYENDIPIDPEASGIISEERIIRGGNYHSNASFVRSAVRDVDDPDNREDRIGFRVVRTLGVDQIESR